ncbi:MULTISPECIES: hypothetical protein [unclassified Spirillospora]
MFNIASLPPDALVVAIGDVGAILRGVVGLLGYHRVWDFFPPDA